MQQREILVIYITGLIQGLALVAFPAASNIFTSPDGFNFSSAGYGSLFLPQAIVSILASLLSMRLMKGGNLKPVFLIGLGANFLSMALLAISALTMKHHEVAFGVLMFATACLGLGFGLTVPCLNTFAGIYFPKKMDSAVLILNALLGLGTALAPVFVAVFVGLGFWWGLPLILAICIAFLLLGSAPLTFLENRTPPSQSDQARGIPSQFWLFAAFALLYGIVETINGNWATVYMSKNLGAGTDVSSMALAAFWGMVTLGRIFFAAIERFFSEQTTFRVLPFVIAVALIAIGFLTPGQSELGIYAFGLAGLGCSALLPLTISFGSEAMGSIRNSVAGGLIAFYLMGYGIAAFGAGQLVDLGGLSLGTVFGLSSIIAIVLGGISFLLSKRPSAN